MDKPRNLIWSYISLAVALTGVLLSGLIRLAPSDRPQYLAENSPVENLTAILYFIAFALSLWQAALTRKWAWVALGLLALIAFLDEVSFGLNALHLAAPKLWQRYPIDGLHDLLTVAVKETKRYWRREAWIPIAGWGAVLVSLIVLAIVLRRHILNFFRQFISRYPLCFVFLTLIALMGLLSQTIDQFEGLPVWTKATEELAEMNAALALTFCALSLKCYQEHNRTN